MFKKNLDTSGRIMRLSIAIILLIFAAWYASWMILAISLFVFFEAWMSWCVLYQVLGWNSCPIENNRK